MMKVAIYGVSNMLENISSAMKNRKVINIKLSIIAYCLLKIAYYFFA